VEYREAKAGWAWAEMADASLAAGDKEQPRLAFQNAAGRPGPAQDRARVRCAALAHAADPTKGPAATLLEEVVNHPAEGRDPAVPREALYLLGEECLLPEE